MNTYLDEVVLACKEYVEASKIVDEWPPNDTTKAFDRALSRKSLAEVALCQILARYEAKQK